MPADDGALPDKALLAGILGDEDASALVDAAQGNADLRWIAAHPDALDMDGETVRAKLLRLAASEDAAVPYVRGFPDRYSADDVAPDGYGVEDVAPSGERDALEDAGPYPHVAVGISDVPHLYQWDRRWGYTVYSSTAFGLTGCGPASLAIAYQGVTGKRDLTPYDMGRLAYDMGYMAQFDGTDPAFFIVSAEQLGMYCESIDFAEESLRNVFEQGGVVIANAGNGYFSSFGGHFLVLTGFADDGKLVMNDPYSKVRSQKTWDPDFIFGECMALYAFWKLP